MAGPLAQAAGCLGHRLSPTRDPPPSVLASIPASTDGSIPDSPRVRFLTLARPVSVTVCSCIVKLVERYALLDQWGMRLGVVRNDCTRIARNKSDGLTVWLIYALLLFQD